MFTNVVTNSQVDLFFTESPTNPFLRCVDIELVSKLCHSKGALVCVDGTFATPMNQKALALGADLVLHSATKYIAGHNDVSWDVIKCKASTENHKDLSEVVFVLRSLVDVSVVR